MEIMESCVPPGFRFHPTEEELVGYYLKRKVNSQKIDLNVIVDVDLYRIEPWDIQDKCKLGYEEQNEWYFFSYKDRKYPTGTRTNRATATGFWKATGRDKAVVSKERIIGMRKTLVFYKGRAPNGRKTDWIMHEYRLQTSEQGPTQEEGWVVCRAFKKPSPSHRQGFEAWNYSNYHMRSSNSRPPSYPTILTNSSDLINHPSFPPDAFFERQMAVEIPKLDNPSITLISNNMRFEQSGLGNEEVEEDVNSILGNQYSQWRSLDGLIAPSSYLHGASMPLVPKHADFDDAQNQVNASQMCSQQELI